MRRYCVLASLILMLLTSCGTPTPPPGLWIDGKFDVGGFQLYLQCGGGRPTAGGPPTVILEHGIGRGATSRTWAGVQSQVAGFAPVCRYDRAGVDASDPPTRSARKGNDLSGELHTLLAKAGVPGPYVLVGHSFGGFPVRLYAHAYPQEVVGMVLVDVAHEDMMAEIPTETEAIDAAAIAQEVRAGGGLGALPLVVVTRGRDRSERWEAFQTRLLALSTNSRQIIAQDSDHDIPDNQPAIIVDAIRQVVKR